MNVISEELITNAKAKEILEAREKEDKLKYEQKNALDNLRKFVKVETEKIQALVEELKKVEKLRERQVISIANFLPVDRDDLRAILYKEYTSFSNEEIDKIVEIVKKFV